MAKVLNVVFGIGVAVVFYVLILLGIQAFYPEVKYEDYCNQSMMYSEPGELKGCADNITVKECRAILKVDEMEKCSRDFEAAMKIYNRNFFIIGNILGVVTLLSAFFFISMVNISAGIICSAIVLILFSFIRGWMSTNDKVKFIVGIIITAIVVTLAVLVNKKMSKKKK